MLEAFEIIIVQRSREAREAPRVGVVCVRGDGSHSSLDRSSSNTALHLDNVFSLDELRAARLDDRGRRRALGRGSEGKREKSEKSCGAHSSGGML